MKTNSVSQLLQFFVSMLPVFVGAVDMQALDSYKDWYSTTESNLLVEATGHTPKAVRAIYTLGYLNSTNSVQTLLNQIDFTIHVVSSGMDEKGYRHYWGQAAQMPGWVFPSLVALDALKPELEEYVLRIAAEPSNTMKVDLLAWSAYAVHGTNFADRIPSLMLSDSNRWSYVHHCVAIKSRSFTRRLHFGDAFYLADPAVKSGYEAMQTNLLLLAETACSNQNATNLLKAVSTYRFIHAPIPEAVSTNDFFQATLGGE